MKRIAPLLLAVLLIFVLAACADGPKTSNNTISVGPHGTQPAVSDRETASDAGTKTDAAATENTGAQTAQPTETEPETGTEPAQDHKTVLVVVFSATGTTKGVAEKIAAIEDADLYEIKAAQEYTAADLNWNDRDSRSTIEQNDKSVRPAIAGDPVALDGYTKVYVGFPIWWGEEPRILDTFAESHDFDGITVIPFCTSSGSGIGRSGKNLAELAKSGNWLDGKRFGGNVSEAELKAWIDGLK